MKRKAYLPASVEEVAELHILPDVQGSHPLGSPKLVAHYGQQVNSQLLDIYWDLQHDHQLAWPRLLPIAVQTNEDKYMSYWLCTGYTG